MNLRITFTETDGVNQSIHTLHVPAPKTLPRESLTGHRAMTIDHQTHQELVSLAQDAWTRLQSTGRLSITQFDVSLVP
jgi:hypothetical protein